MSHRRIIHVQPLSFVELVMAAEETFGFTITDRDAERLSTIGDFKRYFESHIPSSKAFRCTCQRAFHGIRAIVCEVLGVPRDRVRPQTEWTDLLPTNGRRRAWKRIARKAQIPQLNFWELQNREALAALGRVLTRRWDAPVFRRTVGSTAQLLAALQPLPTKAPDEGWSREEISRVLDRLILDVCVVLDFSDDVRLVD